MIKPTKQQIVQALDYLEDGNNNSIVKEKGGMKSIDKTYNGYIAAFGAVVVQMELFPAVMLYHNDKRDGVCRRRITDLIFKLYKKGKNIPQENLFKHLQSLSEDQIREVQNEIMQIVIALKMAVRTFELVESENND